MNNMTITGTTQTNSVCQEQNKPFMQLHYDFISELEHFIRMDEKLERGLVNLIAYNIEPALENNSNPVNGEPCLLNEMNHTLRRLREVRNKLEEKVDTLNDHV